MTPEEKLRAFAALIESSGWKLVAEWLEQESKSALQKILTTDSPDARAVNVGYHRAIMLMLNWPKTQATWFKEQLNNKNLQQL